VVTALDSGLAATFVVRRSSGFVLDVAIEVPAATTVALLGPNGAGKSTALEAIAGLLPIDSGKVVLGDRVLDDPATGEWVPPEGRRIGMLFQDYALFPHLSAIDNVAFGLRCSGARGSAAREEATAWLDRLGVAGVGGRKPRRLSGGEAQRVALARALATRPRLLVLDEPLAALDVTTRARLRTLLGEHLSAFAGGRLLVTHDPTDAFVLADRIAIVENGLIVQEGTVAQVRASPRSAYAADLVGVNFLVGTAAAGEVAVAAGGHLTIAEHAVSGPVLLTIHPRAVSLFPEPPHGSPRNTWLTNVVAIQRLDDRVRVQLAPPLAISAEVTPGAVADLGLAPGTRIWAAVKATEIAVQPG
jgi:molybdate transport system ATP-binding protein